MDAFSRQWETVADNYRIAERFRLLTSRMWPLASIRLDQVLDGGTSESECLQSSLLVGENKDDRGKMEDT